MNAFKIKFKTLAAAVTACMLFQSASAQLINPAVSQLYYNRYLANPAMAGFEKSGNYQFFAAYSRQMESIPGSPTYKRFTFDYGSTSNAAAGLTVTQEEAGLIVNTRVLGTYAYRVRFDEEGQQQLRFGLSLGLSRSRVDINKINGSLTDAVVASYNSRGTFVDADFGLAYINKDLTVEASAYNLRRRLDKSVSSVDYGLNANYAEYYVAAGKSFKVADDLKVDARVALRGIHNYKNIADFGANISYANEPLTLQAVYHTNKSATLGLSFGDKPSRQVYFLYTTATQDLRPYNSGSFEIGLRFIGGKKK